MAVASVLVQHGQIARLSAEAQRVRQERMAAPAAPVAAQPEPVERLSDAEESQLLRLRSQVTMLLARRRELAGVHAENDQLRARLAASLTNAAAATGLPPGYVLRSQARWVGLATPEATIQSFLWALRNRDFTNLLQTLAPEAAQELQRNFQQAGGNVGDLFDLPFPGLAILNRETLPDGSIEATVEIGPGMTIPKFRFQPVGGEWKMGWPQ